MSKGHPRHVVIEAPRALGARAFTRLVVALALGAAFTTLAAVGPGCSSDYAAAPGADGDASADGPSAIDPCTATPTSPACLDEATALFVSASTGNDAAGIGSRERPFRTLTAALGSFTAAKSRIYVCDGTYPEDVLVTSAHSGASVIGGFTCDWQVSKARPRFGASSPALKVTGASRVAFSNVSFHAADNPAGSSIAAFLADSDVTFLGVTLEAGVAGHGTNGTFVGYALPSAAALSADPNTPSLGRRFPCPGGDVTAGGNGGASGLPGTTGTPTGHDNGGSVLGCSSSAQGGGPGGAGSTPDAGAGASRSGDLLSDGWHPASGAAGSPGTAGQGGGGGAGLSGGVGGGGGAGGCGGAGGGPGAGGGGSIALALLDTTVSLAESTLIAEQAGSGGTGGAGQAGTTPGGSGGAGQASTAACIGGNGGAGGSGAVGGGGAGGISVGILYKGTAPKLDDATTAAITIGAKGLPGAGAGQNAGVDGVAAPMFGLK